jgi:hypothetical protein
MRISRFIFAIATLSAGSTVFAQHATGGGVQYRWVDAKGLTHFTDSLNTEAMNNGYDVIDAHGLVVQHISRPLPSAERAAAVKQAAVQAAQEKAAADKSRADIQLLNAYPDEASLKASQQGALDNIDQQMKATRINLRSQDAALTDLLNRAADDERAKAPVPKFIVDQIAKQRGIVASEHTQLAREQVNRDTMVQTQAKELQHYRELKAAQEKNGY